MICNMPTYIKRNVHNILCNSYGISNIAFIFSCSARGTKRSAVFFFITFVTLEFFLRYPHYYYFAFQVNEENKEFMCNRDIYNQEYFHFVRELCCVNTVLIMLHLHLQ